MTFYLVPFRSYRSLFKFWTLCIFEPPFGELRDNIRCSHWAHWKVCSVVGFLLMLTELFSLCVTAEALWAKIDRKSAICKQVGHHPPNFRLEGDVPHQSLLHG